VGAYGSAFDDGDTEGSTVVGPIVGGALGSEGCGSGGDVISPEDGACDGAEPYEPLGGSRLELKDGNDDGDIEDAACDGAGRNARGSGAVPCKPVPPGNKPRGVLEFGPPPIPGFKSGLAKPVTRF